MCNRTLLLVVALSCAPPAIAAQRTFVASFGNDAANLTAGCTLVAPCRAFGSAITKTDSGGEIIVIDSAGYGPVAIGKSLSIIAPAGVYAGVSVFSGNGIDVSGTGIKVVLRGLNINGLGGNNGISFVDGAELRIEKCVVSNMATNGMELKAPNAAIIVRSSEVRGNGESGIYLEGTLSALIDDVQAEANTYGVFARSGPSVSIRNSTTAANPVYGMALEASTADVTMLVSNSVSARNGVGIRLFIPSGRHANLTVEGTVIEGNFEGISDNSDSAGGAQLTVEGSKIVRNMRGIHYGKAGGESRQAMFSHNLVDQNPDIGIWLFGENTVAILTANVVTRSSTGVYITAGASVFTRGDNTIGNNTDFDVFGASMTLLGGY